MRSPVNQIAVNVQNIYEDARDSICMPKKRGKSRVLLTTVVAIAFGAVVGWLVAGHDQALSTVKSQAVGEPSFIDLRLDNQAPETAGAVALGRASVATAGGGWPVVLHRAGDGRFYADLSLDGYLFNILVDPAAPQTRLNAQNLPAGWSGTRTEWPAIDVMLEHLRLQPTLFPISDLGQMEPVVGADLLDRHFIVDVQFDRLRLVPRR